MNLTLENNGYKLDVSNEQVDYYVKEIDQPDELYTYHRIICFDKLNNEIIINERNKAYLPRLSFEEVCAIQQKMVDYIVEQGEKTKNGCGNNGK